jgi:putative RNA 2'-phosphotransferase
MSWVALSKLISHALRHEPWLYELELDAEGWVPVDDLIAAVRAQGARWAAVDRSDLHQVIASSDKRRFEIDGDRIRALYGHTLPGRILKEEAPPPEVLFHGTSAHAWAAIRAQGLVPMGRQYVHMSADVETAVQVGRRKSRSPVLLRVRAAEAHARGVPFWRGNEKVWLADVVPAEFLSNDS